MTDWEAIKNEYIEGAESYGGLARRYGVGRNAVCRRGKEENWPELRRLKRRSAPVEKPREEGEERRGRLERVADKLLDKLEKAIDELDLQIAENKIKTKVIEYGNSDRPDKATREIVEEKTEYLTSTGVIDRRGLQQIAAILCDIKNAQSLKSELDALEQEARIAELRRKAGAPGEDGGQIQVIIEGEAGQWAK